jgi:hypothetical protein
MRTAATFSFLSFFYCPNLYTIGTVKQYELILDCASFQMLPLSQTIHNRGIKKWSFPCKRPLRPIRLWDVEDPTFSRRPVHKWWQGCQPYVMPILVLISVRISVYPWAIVQLDGWGKLKRFNDLIRNRNPLPFRLVSWCLNQLRYHMPQ